MNSHGKELSALQASLAAAKTKNDSATIKDQIKKLNEEVKKERDDVELKAPNSLLAVLLRALKEPVVPPRPGSRKRKTR